MNIILYYFMDWIKNLLILNNIFFKNDKFYIFFYSKYLIKFLCFMSVAMSNGVLPS